MAKRKPQEKSRTDELWELYQSLQLTPEEKAAARAELEKAAKKAADEGVYERAREMKGTIQWSTWWYDLRKDE